MYKFISAHLAHGPDGALKYMYSDNIYVIHYNYSFPVSRASVLETLLTAQTRLVLPTAIHTEDRRERRTKTDRHD